MPTESAFRPVERVEAIIGPEGGVLSHPAGARLVVPAGAFRDRFRVSLRAVPDSSLRNSDSVELIPGTGYDIEVRDANGQDVIHLSRPVTLQLALPPDIHAEEAAVYSVESSTPTQVETFWSQTTSIRASLTHFSRFAAGTAAQETGFPAWIVPWVAVAVTAMMLLAASAVAGSLQRRRARVHRQPGRHSIRG